jgi:hypothetical protein
MTPDQFASIAGAVAWPLTSLLIFGLLFSPLRALVQRLAETLTIKSVKFTGPFGEVELTPEKVQQTLAELLQELEDPANKLESSDRDLFQSILAASGKFTAQDYFSIPFARGSAEHKQLRNLRDRKLIRPVEGGRWESWKHPVVTRFGELVLQLTGSSTNAA